MAHATRLTGSRCANRAGSGTPGSGQLALSSPVTVRPISNPKKLRMQPNKVACPIDVASAGGSNAGVQPYSDQTTTRPQPGAAGAMQQDMQQVLPVQGHQRYARAAFIQCILLGAAAFCAAPLILVLDIAERAALALCQFKQIRQQLVASTDDATAEQQQQNTTQPHQRPSPAAVSNSNSVRKGPRTAAIPMRGNNQRPADLWLLDLWPPFGFMALAVLPPLLLGVRHFITGSPGVLQPLVWCAGSLICQGYANLLLAVWQRGKSHTLSAVAAESASTDGPKQQATVTSTSSGSISSTVGQPHWWRANTAAAEQTPLSDCTVDVSGTLQQQQRQQQQRQQQQQRPPVGVSGTSKVAAQLPRLLQAAGDAFRLWCIGIVAVTLWQQQLAAAFRWVEPLAWLPLLGSSHGLSSMIAALTASAVSLQENIVHLLWWCVDTGLCGGCVFVYLLALAARILPYIDAVLQR